MCLGMILPREVGAGMAEGAAGQDGGPLGELCAVEGSGGSLSAYLSLLSLLMDSLVPSAHAIFLIN